MIVNDVLLRKRCEIVFPRGKTAGTLKNVSGAATLARNVESLGFTLSADVIERLVTLGNEQIARLQGEIIPILKDMVGDSVEHKPMYPNFPKQVMEASDAELYINAIIHYFGDAIGVRIMPEYDKEDRPPLPFDEGAKVRVIGLGDDDKFISIFTQLVAAKSSISDHDKEVVEWFVETYKDSIINHVPEEIPFKEQLCLLVALLIEHTDSAHLLSKSIRTATDVLRIAVSMSEGDVSLAEPTRFKRWKRSERRLLLGYIEGCGDLDNVLEDMVRYREEWTTLFHGLHVGDYASRYPKASSASRIIRGRDKVPTFNGKVEAAIASGDILKAASILVDRPGEFARRLDKLFREALFPKPIAAQFLAVADRVSTPVLLQVYNHFENRKHQVDRAVFPKGSVAKMRIIETPAGEIDNEFAQAFAMEVREVLVKRFSGLEPLGNCYIAPELNEIITPFSQRSASRTLKTIARGSKIPLGVEGDVLRFFIHWKDLDGRDSWGGRVDIDLSTQFLDHEFQDRGTVSYYNLRDAGGCHSGDITAAPEGASEFIDINMRNLARRGIRYVVMCVNSYSQQPFVEVPECFAGWMTRGEVDSGEIYEPKTVVDKFDLTAESKIAIPVLFDVCERKAIWVDLGLKKNPHFVNNVHANKTSIVDIARVMSDLNRLDLCELLWMHIEARGELVPKAEAADVVFDLEFASNIDTILADYL